MRKITKQMIKDYRIKELGYDFMGYYKQPTEIYNFHHLIVPYRNCSSRGLGEGYVRWNGAILCAESSHPYLHLIEQFDLESYLKITSEMIEMNLRGKLMIQNLKAIREILLEFEKKYDNLYSRGGKILIKKNYITNRVDL